MKKLLPVLLAISFGLSMSHKAAALRMTAGVDVSIDKGKAIAGAILLANTALVHLLPDRGMEVTHVNPKWVNTINGVPIPPSRIEGYWQYTMWGSVPGLSILKKVSILSALAGVYLLYKSVQVKSVTDSTMTQQTKSLFEAVYAGNLAKAEEALKAGAAVNEIQANNNNEVLSDGLIRDVTVLGHACGRGMADMVDLLLRYGADPNQLCFTQLYNSLWLAVVNTRVSDDTAQRVVKALIDHGARLEAWSSFTLTPFSLALREGKVKTAKYFVYRFGAHLPACVNPYVDSSTALHDAVIAESSDALKFVLDLNAKNGHVYYLGPTGRGSINVRNKHGQTPYHFLHADDIERAMMLYNAGVPGFDQPDNQGKIPDVFRHMTNK